VRAGEQLGRKPSRDLVQQAVYNVEQGSAVPIGVQLERKLGMHL
jgi:hypothetical protein